ncbi:hypothetical protein Pedsa_0099 [Pseudopedobacter saltans DSM 12145]|uniref:Uncharacterized protein n=1 Tax=Pseudopedobacter saltans (strain ATCC 51119 / DSM 12145 / JCM 21818 / CCUG 39354 / LMG 10337 / NBRC 100064 / NCIMB 13643) TaxID=762903 RepID=F0SCU6_PSESL|nr:hypothetical protein [Pseudopedobacter saltans]ADY50685.1 hypothetical protein Pedsa_0099 [Pseudopedobacter saltans DSM 12145]
MKGLLRYLLMLIISVFYLQAALEINEGPITNTFDDEYDTYVSVENQSSIHSQKTEQTLGFAILPNFLGCYEWVKPLERFEKAVSTLYCPLVSHKRYIKLCTWLI